MSGAWLPGRKNGAVCPLSTAPWPRPEWPLSRAGLGACSLPYPPHRHNEPVTQELFQPRGLLPSAQAPVLRGGARRLGFVPVCRTLMPAVPS